MKKPIVKKKFAVALGWDTESDAGIGLVLVGAKAPSASAALRKALKQAESGKLYTVIYPGEPKTPMTIDKKISFACEVSKLTFIN